MKKKLYIVPGFGGHASDKYYQQVRKYAQENGYTVIPVPIQWRWTTIDRWIKDFEEVVDKKTVEQSVVLGFSLGALVAVLVSTKFSFKKMIICSLSPYFQEDLPKLPILAHEALGKRRMNAFRVHPFPLLTQRTPISFIIGDKDFHLAIERTQQAYKMWRCNKKNIKILQGVGHTIASPEYLKEIKKHLK